MTHAEMLEALRMAGKNFFINNVEIILDWTGNVSALVDFLCSKNPDLDKVAMRNRRVSPIQKIIDNGCLKGALTNVVQNSPRIDPKTRELAKEILKRRFPSDEIEGVME